MAGTFIFICSLLASGRVRSFGLVQLGALNGKCVLTFVFIFFPLALHLSCGFQWRRSIDFYGSRSLEPGRHSGRCSICLNCERAAEGARSRQKVELPIEFENNSIRSEWRQKTMPKDHFFAAIRWPSASGHEKQRSTRADTTPPGGWPWSRIRSAPSRQSHATSGGPDPRLAATRLTWTRLT